MSRAPDPLLDSDPVRVADYRLLGRLGSGGQGVVYLGEDETGRRVAVKLLRRAVAAGAGLTVAQFTAEIEASRRVAAFCTARVLGTGEVGGEPYVVSEYVEGPTLAQRVAERGTLTGAELDRLAIGTMTALAAIHQAGVVHRDFKPANVLLGRDGPRVIDFGIARDMDAETVTGENIVGTPPYMAPEQLDGRRVGPQADMFAWGSVMVYAASGHPAFGLHPLPVVINRILNGEPDLGPLSGDLRELVAACLSKDPADRPSSMRALLRLLGMRDGAPGLLEKGRDRAKPPRTGPAPVGARTTLPSVPRRRGIAVGVAALLLAGAATAGTVLALRQPEPAATSPASGQAAADTREDTTPGVTSRGTMQPTATRRVRIPDSGIVLHEHPEDALRVQSYRFNGCCDENSAFVRDEGKDTFHKVGNFQEPVVAPGGRVISIIPTVGLINPGYSYVRLTDRAGRRETRLRLVDSPLETYDPHWTIDGRHLLLTVYEGVGDDRRSRGFVIVDVERNTVDVVRIADENDEAHQYVWGPGEDTVLHPSPGGVVRVHARDGGLIRTLRNVGVLTRDDGGTVAGLGPVFSTRCPDDRKNVCMWDLNGVKKGVLRLPRGADFGGWMDERHFFATTTEGTTRRIRLYDADGEPLRLLAELPKKEFDQSVLWWS